MVVMQGLQARAVLAGACNDGMMLRSLAAVALSLWRMVCRPPYMALHMYRYFSTYQPRSP